MVKLLKLEQLIQALETSYKFLYGHFLRCKNTEKWAILNVVMITDVSCDVFTQVGFTKTWATIYVTWWVSRRYGTPWSPLVEVNEQPYRPHQQATQSLKLIFFASVVSASLHHFLTWFTMGTVLLFISCYLSSPWTHSSLSGQLDNRNWTSLAEWGRVVVHDT